MKRLLLILFLFAGLSLTAQTDSTLRVPDVPNTDSFMKEQIRRMDSVNTANSIRSMNNNLPSFLSEMQERQRKQKQQMWMRLGFAGLMIIIAIIGFTRRRKQKQPKL